MWPSLSRKGNKFKPATINGVSFALLLIIGWIDYITGYEFGFFIFYFIPVSLSAWFCGKRAGVIMAFASAICWFLSDKLTHHPYPNAYFIYWEMFMRYVSFLTTALTLSKIRSMLHNEERLNSDLQRALQEIEELKKGLQSKSGEMIRGDDGTEEGQLWLDQRTDLQLSKGGDDFFE
ncbi:MAG TPA: hypothetical protein VEI28_07625 [Thermodesulfovibrionales bacterium]|nr:hypothetical protein [Thermodesulfovibrionales bacterium]